MQLPAHIPVEKLPRYIVVEGVIGVGKTTLVERLGALLDARRVFELYEENPFLEEFYRGGARNAFQTEMFFLLNRYQQQESFAQGDLFARFTISDYLFLKCRLFAGLTLTDAEFQLFARLHDILRKKVPRPDLVIYLHAPVDVLLERIHERGRTYEREIDHTYLRQLMAIYTDYFANYTDTPLLLVDTTTIDYSRDDAALIALLDAMIETRSHGGRTSLPRT